MPDGIGISIRVITTPQEFQKMVMEQCRDFLNKKIPQSIASIEEKIANNIKKIFIGSNEYLALVDGPLDAHFGIPKGEVIPRLDSIINTIANSVVVEFRRISIRSNSFSGGITVKAVNAEFTDILNLSAGRIDLSTGGTIPWLEWLLLRGDSIILANYNIEFGDYPQSRSGQAIMVKDDTRAWKVPIGVSGTIRDNWITRAVDNSLDFLEKLIDGAIRDSFNKVF